MAAVVDPIEGQAELEIVLQVAAAAGGKRGVSRSERTGRLEFAELLDRRLGGRIDRAGIKGHIGRHPGVGPIRAGDPRVQRAEIGPARGLADDRLDVVIAVPRFERADDRGRMGQSGQARKCRAVGDAGNRTWPPRR